MGNVVDLAVADGPSTVPGTEHGIDGSPELLNGIIGEQSTRRILDDSFVFLNQSLESLHAQLVILFYSLIFALLAMAASNSSWGTPMTTSPYMWMKRR